MAQPSPSRPGPGERVRLHLADGSGRIEGRVTGWAADTLLLERPTLNGALLDTPMRIARASIATYQPSLGRAYDRGFLRGLKTGALVGGAIGLALLITGVAMENDEACDGFCIPPTIVGGVLGVGATLGGILLGRRSARSPPPSDG